MSKVIGGLSMHKLKKILEMSEEEIIDYHDKHMINYSYGGDFFVNEFYRRQQEKSTKAMETMTKRMLDYTKLMTILTVLNVILVIVTIFR